MSLPVVEEVSPGAADLRRPLEEGRILLFPPSALELPEDDVSFLLSQRQSDARYHKNIAYRPGQDRISGVASGDDADRRRLRRVLGEYSRRAVSFTAAVVPDYARGWKVDYASFRPVEEEGRDLPLRARNDLVHVDAFPTRPSGGDRILRVFTNVNPVAPRVWKSAGTFDDLAGRFAVSSGLLARAQRPRPWDLLRRFGRRLGLPLVVRSPYDRFMLSFHHFLKENRAFQEEAEKATLSFPPGTTWMVFTDMVSHAVLSGRFALEQTFIVARETLALPHRAPIAILERIAGAPMA
ncbi:MAG TPA: Kdo hydroxylase family protein [Vicinamibacteria bacterium]|jgi:hypothetical protein